MASSWRRVHDLERMRVVRARRAFDQGSARDTECRVLISGHWLRHWRKPDPTRRRHPSLNCPFHPSLLIFNALFCRPSYNQLPREGLYPAVSKLPPAQKASVYRGGYKPSLGGWL
ncbi:hypothetical protein Bbelb_041500 [Branchiostoma belcheri]|nr:hypothetical protein Bbelb_041500 [Branchiostoma belcheri]